jgi:amino acid adenylation domain-containing protein
LPEQQARLIPRRLQSGPPPPSFEQQRLWFLNQLEPDSASYNVFVAMRLDGCLDVRVLERAFNGVIKRHEILRTSFRVVDGAPVQEIAPTASLGLCVADLSALPDAEQERQVEQLKHEESQRPFDLAKGPLLRVGLLRLGEEQHIALITTHHIISDAWSGGIMMEELCAFYDAYSQGKQPSLPPLPIQFADYAVWQREWLTGELLDTQLDYWRNQLASIPAALDLPTDYARPGVQTYRGAKYSTTINSETTDRLKSFSRQQGVTLFMSLLAGFKLLLMRYSGQSDIVVGTPIAGRNRVEIEGLIGFFVNTLVIRTEVSERATFTELVKRVKEVTLEAYANQEVPFEKVVEDLQPERELSRTPLFQVMFAFQNEAGEQKQPGGLRMRREELEKTTTKFDLHMTVREREGRLEQEIEYNAELFDPRTIKRMAEHFQNLLKAIANDGELKVREVSIMSEAERQQVLVEWNDTRQEYVGDELIHQLFQQQVRLTPQAIALTCDDQHLSYEELNWRANQLASYLVAQGVGPESLVGIMMDRGIEMVVALLAILKAGGAYVPLDPRYPRQRLAYMLEDAEVEVLVSQEHMLAEIPETAAKVICVDRDSTLIGQQSAQDLDIPISASNLAYVIYTSGSTGRPKGVALEHSSAVTFLKWAEQVFTQEDLAGVLATTSLCFDLSVFEMFAPLSTGGKVIVVDDALDLARLRGDEKVTLINTVPSAMKALVEMKAVPETVKVVNLAGEALRAELAKQVYELETVERLYNLYGPTEDTTYSTYTLVEKGSSEEPTIGVPIANTETYILDEEMGLVPVGVAGELYIAGEGLARGYWKKADMTAEKFVPNPYGMEGGERMYRTGDLCRYRTDGEIEYLGRIDHQVKIRGFRIELGEIEAGLADHEDVEECVVVARDMKDGDKRIVAYLKVRAKREEIIEEIKRHLEGKVPGYMMPWGYVIVEQMPLTANGKVNRAALPEPEEYIDKNKVFNKLQTPIEEVVAGIWEDLLGINGVGAGENFFKVGGHSLLATQMMARVREAFGVDVPLRAVFEEPTLRQLAACIERMRASGKGLEVPPIERVDRRESMPLSFAQQRLWFMWQLDQESAFYNMPTAVRVRGRLDKLALERSINEVVTRHEVLRTCFPAINGQPVQQIIPALDIKMAVIDLSAMCETGREAAASQLAIEEGWRPFNLSTGPLIRANLVRLDEQDHVLLLTLHHIASDGWSIGVLFREVGALYEAFAGGKPSPLDDLALQYGDFAHWQRQWLQGEALDAQLEYWKQQLTNAPPSLALPVDHQRPDIQSFKGAREHFKLSSDTAEALKRLSRQEGATLFMTLLAAFKTLMSRYSNQKDVIVGTPIANRRWIEIEPLIGFFVNIMVLRTDLDGNPTFRELLKRVRQTTLDAYDHQDLPFDKIVEALQPERDLSGHTPLFQVSFALQNLPLEFKRIADLTLTLMPIHMQSAKFDLWLAMFETGEELTGILEYNTDLFEQQTILRMIGHFKTLVDSIIADADQSLLSLRILTDAERQQLLNQAGPKWSGVRRYRTG